ncbi:MAG: TonB-dependent receptor domain-containing protein [Opitutales bacterium]
MKSLLFRSLLLGAISHCHWLIAAEPVENKTQSPEIQSEGAVEYLEPVKTQAVLSDTMLNQKAQLEAEALKNIVSGEKLRNINDVDAADVLNRVPGVSVNVVDGVASGVVVRGVQPDLNKITVDGQNLGGRRGRGSGALNQIAPEFLESIEVTKAPTPDMDADAIGGTVNFNTVSAANFEEPVFAGRVSSSYDDASGLWSHNANVSYGQAFDTTRPSGMLLSVNVQDRSFEQNRYGFRGSWSPDPSGFETSIYERNSQGVGLSGNYDIQLSDETRLFLKVTGNRSNRQFERTRFVAEFRDGPDDLNQNGFEVDRDITTASGVVGLEYTNDLWEIDASFGAALEQEESNNQTSAAFATARIFDVSYDVSGDPLVPEITIAGVDENDTELYTYRRVAEIEQTEDDSEWVAEINARRKFELSFGDFSMKTGAKLLDRTAESNEDRLQYNWNGAGDLTLTEFADPSGETLNGYGFGPGMDTLSIARYRQENPDLFTVNESRSVLASFGEDYDVNEKIWAAYGMATLEHGPFRWIAGLRMEYTETVASGFTIDENTLDVTPVTVNRDYTNWLPGLHGRYMPNANFAVRASATKTVARPGFRDISPYRNIDENDREINSGNPDLLPYESDNLDLTFDFLVPKLGAFQAGVFYKEIDNFIVDQTREVIFEGEVYEEELEVNGDVAELVGFEIAWQNEFTWLPAPFDALETDVSYIWTSSEATLLDPARPETVGMPDQAEHTFKASLGYSIEQWKFDITFDYRSHRLDELVRSGIDQFDSEELSLDFGASYTFSESWSLNLGIRNATAFDRYTYFGDESRLGRTWESSWSGSIGLRWKL